MVWCGVVWYGGQLQRVIGADSQHLGKLDQHLRSPITHLVDQQPENGDVSSNTGVESSKQQLRQRRRLEQCARATPQRREGRSGPNNADLLLRAVHTNRTGGKQCGGKMASFRCGSLASVGHPGRSPAGGECPPLSRESRQSSLLAFYSTYCRLILGGSRKTSLEMLAGGSEPLPF